MPVERLNEYGRWVPAEPIPEPFGILWGRLSRERRERGEPKWQALVRSWFDAREISKLAADAGLPQKEVPS